MVSVLTVDGEGTGHLPTNAAQGKKTKRCLPEPNDTKGWLTMMSDGVMNDVFSRAKAVSVVEGRGSGKKDKSWWR